MLDVKETKSIFYTPCSGIWGTVWIEKVPRVRIDRVRFQTNIFAVYVRLIYRIDLFKSSFNDQPERKRLLNAMKKRILTEPNRQFENEGYRLQIEIFERNGTSFLEFSTTQTNRDNQLDFPLDKIHLWSPEHPYLYDVQLNLYQNNHFIEQVTTYLAFRQISLCNQPRKICLNNEPYFMYGVLDQGYWPDGLYRAPTDQAYQFDIQKMKDLGFNTLRKHMKIEASRWYYWCDVLGMLVWQDMPASDSYDGYEIELSEDRELRLHRDNRTNDLPIPSFEDDVRIQSSGIERSYQSKLEFEEELKSMIDFLSFHPSDYHLGFIQ